MLRFFLTIPEGFRKIHKGIGGDGGIYTYEGVFGTPIDYKSAPLVHFGQLSACMDGSIKKYILISIFILFGAIIGTIISLLFFRSRRGVK